MKRLVSAMMFATCLHAFLFAIGRARILPQPQKIGGERRNAGFLRLIYGQMVGLAQPLVFFLCLVQRAELAISFRLQRDGMIEAPTSGPGS